MNCRQYLAVAYPQLSTLLQKVPTLELLKPQPTPIPEAVSRVVVGQMLSRTAADKIYDRLVGRQISCGHEGVWQLPESELLGCGLSRRKVRTIREFAAYYDSNPYKVEAWRALDYQELSAAVSEHWGLSRWSADMLAIFYFAMPDVFPESDGSILRVCQILESCYSMEPIDPELARPFRSMLARYMWALLDCGELS